MFVCEKVARGHRYLYLVESVREGKRVRQRTIRALGRKDVLHASGELDRLIASLARHSERAMVLILGFLRDLQRRFETAVLLVHHARKSGATRPGQALRGSSELQDYASHCTSLSVGPASSGKRLRFESSRLGCLVGGGSGISIK